MAEREDNVNGAAPASNKVAFQLTKMRDANVKYKNLLKMAKERIEQQEGELKRLRCEWFLLSHTDCFQLYRVSF
jgi:hypothetical protein